MRPLRAANVLGQGALLVGIYFVKIMLQENVFGRNGDVGLELENPVPVGLLARLQRLARLGEDATEAVPQAGRSDSVHQLLLLTPIVQAL
jgi:hypothetical protein